MVPLEVAAAREGRAPSRDPESLRAQASTVVSPEALATSGVEGAAITYHELYGWSPGPELAAIAIPPVRDAVLAQLDSVEATEQWYRGEEFGGVRRQWSPESVSAEAAATRAPRSAAMFLRLSTVGSSTVQATNEAHSHPIR